MIGFVADAAANGMVPETNTLVTKAWEAVVAAIALGALYKLGDLIYARQRRENEYRRTMELLELERRVNKLAQDDSEMDQMLAVLRENYSDISPTMQNVSGIKPRRRQVDDLFIAVLPSLAMALSSLSEIFYGAPEAEMNYLLLVSCLCAAVFGGPWVEKKVNGWTERRFPGYFLSFVMGVALVFVGAFVAGAVGGLIGII
ncbi:MAG: bZIP transcription factor [Pseudomonadota bacterium]